MKRRAYRAATALLAASLACSVAHAEPPPDQKAAAQVLFDKARDLVLQKNFAEACPKFGESLRLEPGLGTMLWLADCYENNGQTASAWAEFKEAASLAAMQKDPREAVARRRVAALEPKLTTLVITTPVGTATPGLEIRRDGVLVSSAEVGLPVPVDPGIHAIGAYAPSHKAWTANIDVRSSGGDSVVVTVPVLAPLDVAAPAPLDELPPPLTTDSAWSTQRYVGATAAVVGVIGLGVGAVLGLSAKSANDESSANGHCLPDNECDATGTQKRHDAQSLATGSTVAFVAGGVLLAGGAALFLTAPTAKHTALSVAPAISARQGGLVVGRAF